MNIPSDKLVAKTDFVGIKSGIKTDRSRIFDVFYRKKVKSAPLIKEAPIVYACKLVKTVDFGDTHYLFIGEIIEIYVNEDLLSKRIPDLKKINPFVCTITMVTIGIWVKNWHKHIKLEDH